jgi:NTE family protein
MIVPVTPGNGLIDREANEIGLVLTGGGARGAYQAGVLRWLGKQYPELNIPIITGVSAGAFNAVKIASHQGSLHQGAEELCRLWRQLRPESVFEVAVRQIGMNTFRWGGQLLSGGMIRAQRVRGLLDTAPLRQYLLESLPNIDGKICGVEQNLKRGVLRALALITTSYTTGQSVIWVEGRDVQPWDRPLRKSVHAEIGVDHMMASAALPLFFPAVRIGDAWYGDGGVRLSAPLSPALHLGASRILAISTRYEPTRQETDRPEVSGYPPPAQIIGVLMNAIFLDVIDQDTLRLERLNELLEQMPEEQRLGLKPVRLLVIRPSRDLGRLVAGYERQLPRAFRFMVRGLGVRQTRSPDMLAMLAFVPGYIQTLIEIGEEDAERRKHEIEAFLNNDPVLPLASADA